MNGRSSTTWEDRTTGNGGDGGQAARKTTEGGNGGRDCGWSVAE